MFAILRKYLSDKVTLTDQDYALIESVCTIKKLRKRQFILEEGEVCQVNVFVCSGLLRNYFVDDKGQDHILYFAPENYWTGDRDSLTSGLPSKYNIDAIENSVVVLIKKDDFEMLYKTIPVFNELMNSILQKSFVVSQERIRINITSSAEEKYYNFIAKFPSIASRVPQHMIASYLGMSAETLSRIRKQPHNI